MATSFTKEAQAGSTPKTTKASKEKTPKEPKTPKAVKTPTPKVEKPAKAVKEAKSLTPIVDIEFKSLKVDYTENGRTKTEKNPERWLRAQVLNSTLPVEIAQQGLLIPLIVRQLATGDYWLINGYRRYMAIKLLVGGDIKDADGNKLTFKDATGGTKVSVIVVPENATAQDLILLELAYNSQVEWEAPARCHAIKALLESGMDEAEIAARTGLKPHLVSRYVEISRNPAALNALASSDAARKSSDVFHAALDIQLPAKKLPETVILEAARASRQEVENKNLTTAVEAAKAVKIAEADAKGIVLTPEDVNLSRREMDKVKADIPEPTEAELAEGFEKIVEKAAEIGGGNVTVAAVAAAVNDIQEEVGKFKKESPRAATAPKAEKADFSALLTTLGNLRQSARDGELTGWLTPNATLTPDENPYVLAFGILIDAIVKNELDADAIYRKLKEGDQFLTSPATPDDI